MQASLVVETCLSELANLRGNMCHAKNVIFALEILAEILPYVYACLFLNLESGLWRCRDRFQNLFSSRFELPLHAVRCQIHALRLSD